VGGIPDVIIHSVIISYDRVELTKQAVASYLETVTVPHTLWIVDNGSHQETTDWILDNTHLFSYTLLGQNRYPGFACNHGFDRAPAEATVLHRADNDWRFLPGWCDEIQARLEENPRLGQLGLRTGEQELHNGHNVGGNCVFPRQIWEEGLRWDERPWPKIKTIGYTEDSFMSPQVLKMGWEWGRVHRPCIESLADENPDDPYYLQSWEDRGILAQAKKAYGVE
jgi:glycosyltransferase involved in cell wall biosynthesis